MAKRLSVVLTLDDKQFQSALRKSANSIKKFGKNMSRLGDDLSRNVTLPILAIGGASVKLASDLEETDSKFRTVFSSIEGQAVQTAQAFQKEFFLAEETSKNLLGSTGDLLVGFGFTEDAALSLSDKVNRLAADLASFQNIEGGTAEASKALTKALVGETESAKALGIVIRQNTAEYKNEVAQIMRSQGVTEIQAKAIANLNIAYTQSSKAIGDVQRTSGSLANQTRQLTESLKQLGAQFGKDLIPLAQSVVNVFNKISTVFSGMSPETRENVIQYGLLAAALGPVMKAFSFLSTVAFQVLRLFRFISPAIALMTKAFLALNPVARLVTLAITGLSAALPFIIEKFKGASDEVKNFTNMVSTAGNGMKNNPLFDVENYVKVEKKIKDVAKEVKRFREVARIEPIEAGPITEFTGGMSAAPQLEGLGLNSDWFKSMEKNLVRFQTTFVESMTNALNSTSKVMGEVSSLFDLQHQKRLNEIEVERQAGIDRINSLNVSEEQRAQLLENLEEKIDKKKAQAQKKQARREKAVALLAATVNTAAAVVAALPNIPLSIAIGALGAAQIATIAGTPIPEFAEGGIISGPTIGLMGEYAGARTNPEVIAPLDKLQGMLANSEKVVVEGVIRGEDIVLSSERYNRRLNNF